MPPTEARLPVAQKRQTLETHHGPSAPETEDSVHWIPDGAAIPAGEAACESPSPTTPACLQLFGCWLLLFSGAKSFGRVLALSHSWNHRTAVPVPAPRRLSPQHGSAPGNGGDSAQS